MSQTTEDRKVAEGTLIEFVREALTLVRNEGNAARIDEQLTLLPGQVSEIFFKELPPFLHLRAYRRDGRMAIELSLDLADPDTRRMLQESIDGEVT